MKVLKYIALLIPFALLMSCRGDEPTPQKEDIPVTEPEKSEIKGFYLLNEGNMGSNKASLDFFDAEKGTYSRNIYATINPTAIKELGDVGNDIKIYGNRLYAVINVSNKVEVMDAQTAKRIGQVDIPNCRYIRFEGAYAYVTSYAGPVAIDPTYSQLGYVAKVDTATLQVVATCLVGYQPNDLEIVGTKIYVANSGGYMAPNYESTVSVIDINTFKETHRIPVAVNLDRMCADKHGNIWVNSLGDYGLKPSRLYCVDTNTDKKTDSINTVVSKFSLVGDSLYFIGYNMGTANYGIVDVAKKQHVANKLITDGTDASIEIPYGILVNPITRDFYITDARDYYSPGRIYCFDKNGKKKWDEATGDIPAHFALLWR